MTATDNKEDVYAEFEKFGRFQLFQYILICIPVVMVSMMHVNYIFVAENVNHRCLVPECEGPQNPSVEIPEWWPEGVNARCLKPVVDMNKYDRINQTCSNNTFQEVLEECHEWVYENNNSIVAELNLGCQAWKASLVGTVHNAGMILSMMVTGWIADKIGRKPTVIICSVGGLVGVLKIFVTNYYLYLGIEFTESVLVSGLYTIAVVLLIEVGGDSKRVLGGVVFSYAVYVGEVLFAFIAMGLKYWKLLIIVVYAPTILFVSYLILLRESVRWQMIRGKTNDAKNTLKITAKINKLKVTTEEIDEISEADLRLKFDVVVQKEKEKIRDILASKEIMIRLAVISFCFFASSFMYYGLIIHSVLLPGNKYTNFVLSSLTAFPGDYLAFVSFKKFGRNISLQVAFVAAAVLLISQSYTPDDLSWLKITLFLFGKCAVAFCFTGVYTYSLELFPTSVRGTLVGFGNTAARVGSMLAPLTPLLGGELDSLPSILFASTAVIGSLLLTFIPETKNLPMFDTIAQIEHHKSKLMTHL
ncbi:organic cation transporter protein-like [Melitaea cinxia]|uniref:organic cation transporter protein-like n=1 Tax=Melitaea cinxia TaxID=113334 RepID=UPI001E273037|nr:organic cation transporter protein-like [Melitaea cinxia]